MAHIIDLEYFRQAAHEDRAVLTQAIEDGTELASAAWSIREALSSEWDDNEAARLVSLALQSEEAVKGAIAGLILAMKLKQRIIDIHDGSRADDVSVEEHRARLLAMGELGHSATLVKCISLFVNSYMRSQGLTGRAPIWSIEEKEVERGSDHPNL